MKTNLFKIYLLFFFLLTDFMAFAQPGMGANDGNPSDLENDGDGDSTPEAPINGKLIWLGITAILFAYYTYKNNRKEA
jgi:hypothetical protein